jgi:Tfp pilus assembly protein PilX
MTLPTRRQEMSAGRYRARERGIVMWVALAVLVAMSIAGLAMVRQMGGGIAIAGNVAFKENATSSADSGTETARAWYTIQSTAVLNVDAPAQGYYATWGASVDPTTFNWAGGSVAVALDAGVGNTSRYIIQRLCLNPGSVSANTQVCSDADNSYGQSKGGGNYNQGAPQSPVLAPYFRVTTQVTGPRNTVSYTQVILN